MCPALSDFGLIAYIVRDRRRAFAILTWYSAGIDSTNLVSSDFSSVLINGAFFVKHKAQKILHVFDIACMNVRSQVIY